MLVLAPIAGYDHSFGHFGTKNLFGPGLSYPSSSIR